MSSKKYCLSAVIVKDKFILSFWGMILLVFVSCFSSKANTNEVFNNPVCHTTEFASFALTGPYGGTGVFSNKTGLPDFTFTASGDVYAFSVGNYHNINDSLPVGFESSFGNADNEDHLYFSTAPNFLAEGAAITQKSSLIFNFNSATPSSGWAFSLIDLEQEQVQIKAVDANGVAVPLTVINSWFSGSFDADVLLGRSLPFWDAAKGAVIGNQSPQGSWHYTIPANGGFAPDEASGVWLSPNVPLSSLTLEMQVFASSYSASTHVYMASCKSSIAAIDDQKTTDKNMAKLVTVLANDFSSANIDLSSVEVISFPSNGTPVASNGSVLYIPSNNHVGSDVFEYRVCDTSLPLPFCDTASVAITTLETGPCLSSGILSMDSVCTNEGLLVQAANLGASATYFWDFGPDATPATSTEVSEVVYFSTVGMHTISLTVYQGYCTEVFTEEIDVNIELMADAGEDVTICPSDSTRLGGTITGPPGATYTWHPFLGLDDPQSQNPMASPGGTTNYTLYVTYGNCTSTADVTVNVDVLSVPYAYAGMNQLVCREEAVALGGDSNNPTGESGSSFSWSPTTGLDDPTSPTPLANPSITTAYEVAVSKNGCLSKDVTLVEVLAIQAVDAGAGQQYCLGETAAPIGSITNDPFMHYQWSPTTGVTNPLSRATAAAPTETTLYTLTGTRFGCHDTAQVWVVVENCNQAPIGVADTTSFYTNEMGNGNVLDNDKDFDGDNLSAKITLVENPTHGAVSLVGNGNFVYTPTLDYVGMDSFVYEVCDDAFVPLCDMAVVYVDVLPQPCIGIQLKAFMEGPMAIANSSNYHNNMRADLNVKRGILPGQTPINGLVEPTISGQPYNLPPWNYEGREGIGWTDLDYETVFQNFGFEVVDWVLVSIVENISSPVKLLRVTGLVLEDGTIVFEQECYNLPHDTGPYFLVVEHRNHMGIMTPTPLSQIDGVLTYDFTKQDSYRGYPNPTGYGQKEILPGVFAMYACDGNQVNDTPSYDISGQDKIKWSFENGRYDQYLPTDYDMDGDVNGFDKVLWNRNNGISSRVPR